MRMSGGNPSAMGISTGRTLLLSIQSMRVVYGSWASSRLSSSGSIMRSFSLPAARFALIRLLRFKIRTCRPNASVTTDPVKSSSNVPSPATSASRSILPKSVFSVDTVPFRSVA